MKKISGIIIFLLVSFCINIYSGYSQVIPATSASKEAEIKTYDVSKDGKPVVRYYSDGKYVIRVDADTNHDFKPDVIMYIKDGKFELAEVDTNYDGKIDKKFTDVTAFNKWLNKNHPDFNDKLNRSNWQFDLKKF